MGKQTAGAAPARRRVPDPDPPDLRRTYIEDLNRDVAAAHQAGAYTAVLELADRHLSELDREFSQLTPGHELRRMTAQEFANARENWTPDKVQLNKDIAELSWRIGQWRFIAGRARGHAANEAHGWTILPDGTPAKVLDNGQVLSAWGGVRYEEEDGTIVDTSKRGDAWQRRHREHERRFAERIRVERIAKARQRSAAQRRPSQCSGERRPAASRRTASSSTSSGTDPGEEPSERRCAA